MLIPAQAFNVIFFSDEDVVALSKTTLVMATPDMKLKALDLSSNHLGDEGARALAGSPHLRRLRQLDLRHNQIGRSGVEALLASTTLPRLDELDLRGNELCRDDKPRLAARFGGIVHV